MENNSRKVKWTKKLRAIIISLSLAFVVALGGACAAIGISVAGKNQRLGGTLAGSTAGDSNLTPDETFYAGATVDGVTYDTNAKAWAAAVDYSVTNSAVVQFNLTRGWKAVAETGFGSAATYPDAFGAAGSLNVPEGATVILNISKNIKLDRNLAGATAVENGEVISVSGGHLVLQGDGIVTGGNTAGNGGGVYMDGGVLDIYGGTISGNKAHKEETMSGGGAAYLCNGATVNMFGGAAKNNTSDWCGGAFCVSESTINLKGGLIADNTATLNGGGIYMTKGTLNITDGTISGNAANNTNGYGGGGVFTCDGGTVTMNGGVISNNTTSYDGGGIYISNGDTFTMTGGEISGNTALENRGEGIVYVGESATFDLNGGKISNNNVLRGAIFVRGTLNMTDGEISGNKASLGGGVYVNDQEATMTMTGGIITGNTTTSVGAGIYVNVNGVFNFGEEVNGNYVGEGVISNNTSSRGGAGVAVEDATANLYKGTITGNSTESFGGGLGLLLGSGKTETTGVVNVYDVTITDNTADGNGGGVYMAKGGTLNLGSEDGTKFPNITGNHSLLQGGGIYDGNGLLTIHNANVSNNTADDRGGAMYIYNGVGDPIDEKTVVTIDNITVDGNYSGIHGGGIYTNVNVDLTIKKGTISNNTAVQQAGGLLLNQHSKLVIGEEGGDKEAVKFIGNEADYGGGIFSHSPFTVYGAKISENKAPNGGGGIFISRESITIHNATITDNEATYNYGGGINFGTGTEGTIYAADISRNKALAGGGIHTMASSVVHLSGSRVNGKDSIQMNNNSVGNANGGALCVNGSATMSYVTFDGNYCGANGGAMSIFDFTADHITVTNNVALGQGGGIRLHNNKTYTLTDSVISGNTSHMEGGGIYDAGISTTIKNVTITDNTAVSGGGGYAYLTGALYFGGKITINNNTASGVANNFYRMNSDQLCQADNTYTADSYIGISAMVSTPVISVPNARVSTVHNDNSQLTVTTRATTGSTTHTDVLLTVPATANATQWVNAATSSSDSNPMSVVLSANWTATTSGSTTSFGTNASGKKGYLGGALHVPAGANIILNLNNKIVNRNLTSLAAVEKGHVIIVEGTLTIISNGNIKGANSKSASNGSYDGGGIYVGNGGKLIMSNGVIEGNKATSNGAGVYLATGAKFEMTSGVIYGNNASSNGAGVYVYQNAELTMNGGYIYGNTATGNGGGVYNAGTFELNGGYIGNHSSVNGVPTRNGNVGTNGAGLYNVGTFTMNGGGIYANGATNAGGGIFNGNSGAFTISGGTIGNANTNIGNYAAGGGGGIYLNSGTLNISGVTIVGNTTVNNGPGAGIFANARTTVNMTGGTIQGNKSVKAGGGIYLFEGTGTTSSTKGATLNLSGKAKIINNTSSTDGGGIFGGSFTTINIDGGVISGNSASQGGGVFFAGTVTMDDGEITGNTVTTGNGGGACGNGVMEMNGGTISGNIAGLGAGVYSTNRVTLSGGEISGNTSSSTGGGICVRSGSVTIDGGTISNNTATLSNGGGIYGHAGSSITIKSGTISDNEAIGDISNNNLQGIGGGIYTAGTFTMSGGLVTSNTATKFGGGMYIGGSDSLVTITGGTISYNEVSAYRGGGIYLDGQRDLEIEGGEIINNKAGENGGGIAVAGSALSLFGGTISGNTAERGGGGIHMGYTTSSETALYIDDTAVISNNSATSGGGVYICGKGRFEMSGGTISGNASSTSGNGGGLYIYTGATTVLISGGEIINNTSGANGGGVFITEGADVKVTGGTISDNNTLTGGGGGIAVVSSSLTVSGGMISGNVSAQNGGGISSSESTITINGTAEISDNSATTNGGGVNLNAGTGSLTISGGEIYGNEALDGQGGGIFVNSTLTMEGGKVYGNYAANGAGVTNNAGTFTMTGGEIYNNVAVEDNGGGVYLPVANSTFTMSGTAKIYGNEALFGAGVYVWYENSVFNMNGGEIFGNKGTNGAGLFVIRNAVANLNGGKIYENNANSSGGGAYIWGMDGYREATIVVNGTEIYGNTAKHGAGISTAGTLQIKAGSIYDNIASGNGGGVYVEPGASLEMTGGEVTGNTANANGGGVDNEGTAVLSGGEISGNSAQYGGGVYSKADTTIGGVTITGNYASRSGGGVHHLYDVALKLSGGATVVSDNYIGKAGETSDKLSNIHAKAEYGYLTVTGAFASGAKVGITFLGEDGEQGSTFTGGYGRYNNGKHPHEVFTADEKKYTVGVEGTGTSAEAILVSCFNLNLTVFDKDGNETETTAFIKVDSGSKVTYSLSADKKSMTFVTTQGGLANVKTVIDLPVVAGYTPYVYNPADGNSEVESGAGVLASISADRELCVGYRADEDTPYTVYYVLQQANVTTNNGYVTATKPSELEGLSSVKKYEGTGTTDGALAYLDKDGLAFADWDEKQYYSFDKINIKNPTIAGDGSSYVLVYLKLNEYTVTYSAPGASPSSQTKKLKYGATITAPSRTPTKTLSQFAAWCYDAAGTQEVDFATSKVTGNVTLYAKFTTKHFKLTFNLNISDDGEHALPEDSNLAITTNSANLANGLVTWDVSGLFPDEKNFMFTEESTGICTIDYTVDNVPQTISIKGIKPSAVGYTFDGWYLNDTLTTTIKKPTVNTYEEMELVAHWSPARYTVHFDKQDGSFNAITEGTVYNRTLFTDIPQLQPENAPTRAGYNFEGWYITKDEDDLRYSLIEDNLYESYDGSYFSLAMLADLYGNSEDGYDFSNLTLYAGWSSIDVFIDYIGDTSKGRVSFKDSEGNTITINDPIHIGDTITVEVTENNGFEFVSLIVNGDTLNAGVKQFTVRGIDVTNDDTVEVSAVFTEKRYDINYNVDGGTSTSSSFDRTYTKSQLEAGEVRLSSRLTKQGYDFAGWRFKDGRTAFEVKDAEAGSDLFDKDLRLTFPVGEDGYTEYRHVYLTAVWEPQAATVNLYNATYNNIYNGDPENGYIIKQYNGTDLHTAMEIEIINPKRSSFDFLGWATSRNGAVVYPVDESKETISFTVFADHDVNGSALNRNNLYAVWHIKGVDRIDMTVDNNNSTYGGAGITMTAKTAQNYENADGETISLTYKWYRIFDGMYDDCFTVGSVFIENEKVTGYEFNGKYYDATGKNEVSAKPAGEAFEYRRFEESSVAAGNCVLAYTQTRTPSQTSTLNVKNVTDCGTYVCVVEVVATSTTGSTTRAGGYGEIEIAMNKAVYGNLVLENATVTYNARAQWNALLLKLGQTDLAAITTEDGITYLALPDYRLDAEGNRVPNSNSKVIVTYRYYVTDGMARREITDLNEIKNVGTYFVVVSFEFTPDGDKGNYEALSSLEAELMITPFTISNIGFTFVHGEDRTTTTFNGPYDGTAYSVEAAINDRFGMSSDFVAETDDVRLKVIVNDVTDNGEVEHEGETVSAGRYSLVITGLEGEDAGNYVLMSGLTLRQEYTIGKNVYAVDGHIKFDDLSVVFDNELHALEIEVEEGYELPETVTVNYEVTEYEAEDGAFTAKDHVKDNFNADGNAGRYAGMYTVTVTFEDSASGNYAALESMTATLTITKANLFKYFNEAYGEDLLSDAGFVGGSFAFNADKSYLPTIAAGSRLANTLNFAISYKYYAVNEETGARTELEEGKRIYEPGKYEIVAEIEYASALYSNNFEEVQANDSTITYVIRNVDVESVTVIFTEEFEASGRVVKLGEGFDYSWIEQIDVEYVDRDSGERSTRHIVDEDSIALALITLENGRQTFWHVGNFAVKVGVYETDSEAYTFKVIEEVENVVIKYSIDGGAFSVVPANGLELLTGRNYSFVVEYSCTDENGSTITKSSDATIAAGGLALGKNVLTVTEEFYTFGEVAVDMYEVLTGVTWEYSLDGNNWTAVPESNQLVYAGKPYSIRAVSDDKTFGAHTQSGLEALNVNSGYVMEVGRSGSYRIDETYAFRIVPKVLNFVWKTNTFEYDMFKHVPEIQSSGLEAADEGLVTFGFNYYDALKNRILSTESIKTVGTYYVSVTLGGDVTARNNYTLDGAENAEYYEFNITKAAIRADVYYNEHNYGKNVTFAGNTELRLNAMKADFGENNATVAGQFRFIKPVDDSYEVINGKDFEAALENTGELTVNYVYVPDNKNYDELIGTLTLNVKEPNMRTGDGSLSVEFGRDAIQFYLVEQTLDTRGIEVYQLYDSTYQENGVWYGARTLIENPMFRINGYGGSIENYKITSLDLSGGKITLIARSGSNSGTIDIPVIDKTPIGIEVSNEGEYRDTYYVGETPDFADITFRVLFGGDTPAIDGLKVGTIKHDYTLGEITDGEGTFTVRFSYFSSVNIPVTFKKAPKEDFTVLPLENSVLQYTGTEITVPTIRIKLENGEIYKQDKFDELGIAVKVSIYDASNRLTTYIKDEGKYTIIYTFDVTNPRFNPHDPETFEVEVTTNPYNVDITVPDTVETPYTGEDIEIPKPTVGEVTDSTNHDAVVPETSVIKVYTILDEKTGRTEEVSYGSAWTVRHAGRYVITVTVRVARSGGEEPYTAKTATYDFVVTQAKNDQNNASITGPEFIIKGADGNVDFTAFKVTADFGASEAVWEYSTTRDGGYTTEKPTAVGTYYVRARIPATDDYEGLITLGKRFEVRGADINLDGNGSVSGGNGIGEGWKLEINRMDADAVGQVSISKQDVLDGYEVVLKKANGTAVSGEGEYTVRVKLPEELSGRSDLKVFFKDANGNTSEKSAKVTADGYIEFKTSEFGTFIITSAQPAESIGLLVAVIVLGVIAAGMITACVIVFVKKKKKGAQQ